MAIALNLALCFKPLTRKIQASISLSVSQKNVKQLTSKQKEKHTFVCCFSVARKFLSAL